MDVEAVERAARTAAEAVRAGQGPHLLELRTYRFRAHSMFDPELYRSKEEVEAWKARCPIETFAARAPRPRRARRRARWHEIETATAAEVDDAVAFATRPPWEPVATLTRHVYSEAPQP